MKCRLLWQYRDGIFEVAFASLERSGPMTRCHNKKLNEGYCVVTPEVIIEGREDLALPFPPDEIEVLGQAVGWRLVWPSTLVRLDDVCI